MNSIRFILGFIAAFFDEFKMLSIRNWIHELIPSNGRTLDGFDFAYDHIINHRRHWREFYASFDHE